MFVQAIKYNEEHSHGSLVALAIAIIAIFAAVNFNKVQYYHNVNFNNYYRSNLDLWACQWLPKEE